VHNLTIDRAVLVFQKSQVWFGPSAIILQPIDRILSEPTLVLEECVIDGRIRIAALRRLVLTSVKITAWQVPAADRIVCTELILRGHYDRAFGYLPECWSHSVGDIQAFTGVPMTEALQCFASRQRLRPKVPRLQKRDNEKLIKKLRTMFEAFEEGEEELTLDDIRKAIYDPPTARKKEDRANSYETEQGIDSKTQ
jgi:hypothetical protein